MGQRRNYAEAKGAPIKLKTEESALSMEQKSNDAAVKDAQIVPSKEAFVLSMVQRSKMQQ